MIKARSLLSLWALLSFLPLAAVSTELTVKLQNPIYEDGVLETSEGGIIEGDHLRIQARKIKYSKKVDRGLFINQIEAEGDILVVYHSQIFTAQKLEFDFEKQKGVLYDGRTQIGVWFVGGDEIKLESDGGFQIANAWITTSENQDISWRVKAFLVHISKDKIMKAKNVKFEWFDIPLFWLPSYKINLNLFRGSPIKYKLTWDKGLGPRASMRYLLYGSKFSDIYFRLDYRLKRGFGGAIETEFYSEDEKNFFITRSYGAHDKTVPDERGPRRYRLQGAFNFADDDDRTVFKGTWDKYSDDKMPADFPNDDFEISSNKLTQASFTRLSDDLYGNLRTSIRANTFQSLNQELPALRAGSRMFPMEKLGILPYFRTQAAYLDYTYADLLNPALPNIHSGRLESQLGFLRPFVINHASFVPRAEFSAIAYSNSQTGQSKSQAVLEAAAEMKKTWIYAHWNRLYLFTPTIEWTSSLKPKTPAANVYVFSMDDGYSTLNQLKIGFKSSQKRFKHPSSLNLELFTYGFFATKFPEVSFPRGYLTLDYLMQRARFNTLFVWNFEEKVLDNINASLALTISDELAFSVEGRHRSKFFWKRSSPYNFYFDTLYSDELMETTPLSDRRNTILFSLKARASPGSIFFVQSRWGFGRAHQHAYTSFKISNMTQIADHWWATIGFEQTPNDSRFTYGLKIIR